MSGDILEEVWGIDATIKDPLCTLLVPLPDRVDGVAIIECLREDDRDALLGRFVLKVELAAVDVHRVAG